MRRGRVEKEKGTARKGKTSKETRRREGNAVEEERRRYRGGEKLKGRESRPRNSVMGKFEAKLYATSVLEKSISFVLSISFFKIPFFYFTLTGV